MLPKHACETLSTSAYMKSLLLLLLFILPSSAALSADFPIDYSQGKFEDQPYETVLMYSNLKGSSEWDAEKIAPPLSPKKASSLAESSIQHQIGNHHLWSWNQPGWLVTEVALVQVPGENKWYYKISLRPRVPGSNSFPSLTVFVTMDGKTIPPVRKK